MKTYDEWNSVIIDYVTSSVPLGKPVFLTIDDDALIDIGYNYLMLERDQSVEDFERAIRFVSTIKQSDSRKYMLHGLDDEQDNELPNCVAFLASMVVAAHRMRGDEGVDESNYFTRFNELLGLDEYGRPEGMHPGDEEHYWRIWNEWLVENNYETTAERGPEGSSKYITYPIEQSTLRARDKEFLARKFRMAFADDPRKQVLDEDQVGHWLSLQDINRKHLKKGFSSQDVQRAESFYSAAYRVYESMNWQGGEGSAPVQRVINCGLIRSVSLFNGVTYRALPRVPPNWKTSFISVEKDGDQIELSKFRANLFKPIWEQQPFVENSLSYAVEGDSLVNRLVFPEREFWILTNDPEDPCGELATWERYPELVGSKVLILVKTDAPHLLEALEKYNSEELIGWDETSELDGCIEYRGCMVLSRDWETLTPSDEEIELYNALRPKSLARISLTGGLRAPHQNAWLIAHPPSIKLYGFEENFDLQVIDREGNAHQQKVCAQDKKTLIGIDAPGVYKLKAYWADRLVCEQSLKVIDWDELVCE